MHEISAEDLKKTLHGKYHQVVNQIGRNVSQLWCSGTAFKDPNNPDNNGDTFQYIALENVRLKYGESKEWLSAQGNGDKLDDAMADLLRKIKDPTVTLMVNNAALGKGHGIVEIVYCMGVFVQRPPPRIVTLLPKPLRLRIP